jgi:hypothetical protein
MLCLQLYDAGYDVVVNCSGSGAAKLVPDPDVYALRGQVIKVGGARCCDGGEGWWVGKAGGWERLVDGKGWWVEHGAVTVGKAGGWCTVL